MENQVQDGIYQDKQVNIPIQLLSITDRDGKITPLWFRVETEEHEIRKFRIEDIISRSEKNYVGIKEKQFVCRIEQDGIFHLGPDFPFPSPPPLMSVTLY